ncbi:MAG: DNA helicase [Betaproteobacteria bacterium HGW-Betaproteobacteria-22]|nr:MAG: DNA helicase [Betaproteobacteria bacterium HGW-Betaproteobacteria-22]
MTLDAAYTEHTAHPYFDLAADAHNRLRALELKSFIVEAPAGAGKTELLTQRYLKLLTTVNAPEEIIAITFTNKAAAEMRARILDSLMKAANQEKPQQAHKQITYNLSLQALQHAQLKDWQLIENPSRLRIFTIDSLCAHLARQMPLMSRFGAQPRVTEDADSLYAQAAEQTLALLEDKTHSENKTHSEIVKAALRYVDNDASKLKKLLIAMLEKRDQWLHHAQYEVDADALQLTLQYLVEQDLAAVELAINARVQHALMPVARFAASNLPCDHPVALLTDWETPITNKQACLPMWRALADLMLTDKGEPRKLGGLNVKVGFPATDDGRAQKQVLADVIASIADLSVLHRVRSLPDFSHESTGWQIITMLSKLLNLAVAELWLTFQRAGEVDFSEIAQRATHALTNHFGEPTELALKLDYQIQHLLVDEFQDTSPSQIALLEQLTLGWQPDDGRTLFTVGDPMQSIYRFRKANVGLFIDAARHGVGNVRLERLQLYRNNRSCPAVVDWINHTFAPVFPPDDEVVQGAIHYRPFIATKQEMPQSGVEVHPVISPADETTELASQREAEAVISIIQAERGADPERKIAVLVRSKKHLSALVSRLRRDFRDVPFQAVEIEALQGRQIVQDLLSLTHALHHRADRVHWLATLRAPWCGLTLKDLHTLAGHDHQSTLWSLMQNDALVSQLDGKARLLHMRDILAEAFAAQGRMNVSRWVRGLWLMLNGAACLWAQSDVVDVQAFFSCLDRLDRSNQFSPERMESEITKLFAAPDSRGGNLQMMTIHKSKGLEFDTVILPGLGAATGGNHDDKPLVLWEEVVIAHQRELLAAPFVPKGARDKEKVSPYDYLEAREHERDANESARVLYVAATRAERKLHLVGVANQNAKGEVKPAKNTYLDLLWPTIGETFKQDVQVAGTATAPDDIADFTPQLVRLAQPGIPAILRGEQSRAIPTQFNTHTDTRVNTKPSYQSSLDADVGTLVHRYLEMIAQQGVMQWTVDKIASLEYAMQHWLHQQGHAGQEVKAAVAAVQEMLIQTVSSVDGQWVLKVRPDAGTELGITHCHQSDVMSYVIDRTFIEDGVRWIVDYKSVALENHLTDDELKVIAQQYQSQLDNYAMLFADEGIPVKQAIYFLRLGRLITL